MSTNNRNMTYAPDVKMLYSFEVIFVKSYARMNPWVYDDNWQCYPEKKIDKMLRYELVASGMVTS